MLESGQQGSDDQAYSIYVRWKSSLKLHIYAFNFLSLQCIGELTMDAPNQEQPSPSLNCFDSITCTTFNILAPIYKRLNSEVSISIQSYPRKHHGYSRNPPLFPLSIKLWDSSFQSLESEHRECWLSRNKRILDQLLHLESSILCLQVLLLRSVFIWAQEDVCEQYMLEKLQHAYLSEKCSGILGGQRRTCEHVWEETWRCWICNLQTCTYK